MEQQASLTTLLQLLEARATEHTDTTLFSFLQDGETRTGRLSYEQLLQQAKMIAAQLQQSCQPGDRALLLFQPGLYYISALMGCIAAGVIAVPAYPPRNSKHLPRLQALIHDCQAHIALTSSQLLPRMQNMFQTLPELATLPWLATDEIDSTLAQHWQPPAITGDSLALLQYTSGSTGHPKGVMVSHRNLLINAELTARCYGQNHSDTAVTWLPPYHDMGLMGSIIQPLYAAFPAILMSPVAFLQKPLRWLYAMSDYQATATGAPNFAYELCIQRATEDDLAKLDLSHWQLAFNGAEPVQADVIKQFSQTFAKCGFQQRAFFPCYGMAEATLAISGGQRRESEPTWIDAPTDTMHQIKGPLVGCGEPLIDLLIVDPESLQPCMDGQIGEIWVSGDSIAQGYWQQTELTATTFHATLADDSRAFMRTGDLGLLQNNELYIAGRLKDLMIIRGTNHYPQDIEYSANQAHELLPTGGAIAFTNDDNQLVLVHELKRQYKASNETAIFSAIRQIISAEHELQVAHICLLRPSTLPRTSSGKVQRRACANAWQQKRLSIVAEWHLNEVIEVSEIPAPPPQRDSHEVYQWLRQHLATALSLSTEAINNQSLTELGLDSLQIAELSGALEDYLQQSVALELLWDADDLKALANTLAQLDNAQQTTWPQIKPEPDQQSAPFPLNPIQQAYWLGRNADFNLHSACHFYLEIALNGLDLTRLNKSWNQLIQRHAMLRCIFTEEGQQHILPSVPDYVIQSDSANLASIRERMSHQIHTTTEWPLFELCFSQSEEQQRLHISFDLLIADVWSFNILLHEWQQIYEQQADEQQADEQQALPDLTLSFRDYLLAEMDWQTLPVIEQAQAYWQQKLPTLAPAPELPLACKPSDIKKMHVIRHCHQLNKQHWLQFQQFAKQHQVTPSMAICCVFAEVLAYWSKRQDFTLNLTLFNRQPAHAEVNQLVGDFTSLLLLGYQHQPQQSFAQRAQQLQQQFWQDYQHRHVNGVTLLQQIQHALPIVFTSALGLPRTSLSWLGQPAYSVSQTPQTWLDHQLWQEDDCLLFSWDVVETLFPTGMMEDMFSVYWQRLETLATHANSWLQSTPDYLPMAQHAQRQQVNKTQNPLPIATLPELFQQQLNQRPKHPAIIQADKTLSYEALYLTSQHLAHQLQQGGAFPNSLIAIILPKGWQQMVACLAIMEAGSAYLPIDPSWPIARQRLILQQAEVKQLITTPELIAEAYWDDTLIAHTVPDDCPQYPPLPLINNLQPSDLAYVIFTSGSTGTPKGVMISHQAAANIIQDINQRFNVNADDMLLGLSALSFDLSVYDIFGTLAAGATLLLPNHQQVRDTDHWQQLLQQYPVTVWNSAPALMMMLLHSEPPTDTLSSLRLVLLSGDWIPLDLPTQLRQHNSHTQIVALGGATEAAIWSNYHLIDEIKPHWRSIPYGTPLANQQFYVLNQHLQACPDWVSGQLYIAGDGLAQGYWRDEHKTNTAFIHHPQLQQRLYRTGDLGRYWPDGTLEFLGREDFQVKLQGYRIELGEIEAILQQHPHIQHSIVTVHDESLAAYVVADKALEFDTIRDYLAQHLPHYMLPSLWQQLDALPLSANGKVDRGQLPKPSINIQPQALDEAYQNPTEIWLAEHWQTLLNVPQIGRHDDFFQLGNSLQATQSMALIRQHFNIDLALRQLFEQPTLAQLAQAIEQAKQNQQLPLTAQPAEQAIQAIVPSYAQERLWFLQQWHNSSSYNLPAASQIYGELNIEHLQQACQYMVNRHQVLRSRFKQVDGDLVYEILAEQNVNFKQHDLQHLTDAEQQEEVRCLSQHDAQQLFDLEHEPLFRITLLTLKAEHHILLLTLHHAIADGWSLGIIMQEMATCYTALLHQMPIQLTELTIQYSDYAWWQRQWLAQDVLQQQLDYWRQQLHELPLLELPHDYPRPAIHSEQGSSYPLVIPKPLLMKLSALSQQQQSTLFMTLFTAFNILLYRYSGQSDIGVGTPVAGRQHPALEDILGCFVNTLVLRTDLAGNPTFEQLLQRVKRQVITAQSQQDIPFEQLVQALQPQRDLSYTPLFQVMFVLQNAPMPPLTMADCQLKPFIIESQTAKFDLTLTLWENSALLWETEGLVGHFEYRTDLFKVETIARMAENFLTLLKDIAKHPQHLLSQLKVLSTREKNRLLYDWNQTQAKYPQACLHQLFARQALRTPQSIACIAGQHTLTYQQLQQRSNKLAQQLQNWGIGNDQRVGICLPRNQHLPIAILAVLKSGAAYVPLDPAYPQQRLQFMLDDATVSMVITEETLLSVLPTQHAALWCMDSQQLIDPDNLTHCQTDSTPTPNSLAYIIYTSGSTGVPKGVAINHQSAVTLMHWGHQQFSTDALQGMLFSTSICFDLSIFELFLPLSWGGMVIIADNALHLAELNVAEQVTTINTVPSAITELLRLNAIPKSVRMICLAGEALKQTLVQQIYTQAPWVEQVYNLYGPSEDTTYSTYYLVPRDSSTSPLIGRPITNTAAYLLDPYLNPVPIGAHGELYLAGDGLAQGYLNREDLTAERFVNNPFRKNQRMYRTGDIARYVGEGYLDYLGRIDHQIKIRGFRIELGEIENALRGLSHVTDAVVIAQSDLADNLRLVAYLAIQDHDASQINQQLQQQLPDYMLPDVYIGLNALPLTANGKIDRNALPAPDWQSNLAQQDFIEASTPTEIKLSQIWQQTLGFNRISSQANFFELGGHSLLATKIVALTNAEFDINLSLNQIFQSPTIQTLAQTIDQIQAPEILPLVPYPEQAPSLSFAQQRLWFLDQLAPNTAFYNMPAALMIHGPLDIPQLQHSLTLLLQRHDNLRSCFKQSHDHETIVIKQTDIILPHIIDQSWPNLDLQQVNPAEQIKQVQDFINAQAQQPFDLQQGPLLRCRLLKLNSQQHVIVMVLHHIVADGWSINILLEELSAFYSNQTLAELPVQYADYAWWQRQWLEQPHWQQQLDYWQQQLQNVAILELPTDHPRPAEQRYYGQRLNFQCSIECQHQLQQCAKDNNVTLFMLLLTLFKTLLFRYTQQTDLSIGTPISGRHHQALQTLIGFFVNTLVIRSQPQPEQSFADYLQTIKATALNAYANQDIPFEQLVEKLSPQRNMAHSPLFQVMFAMQNVPLPALDIAGLTFEPIELDNTTAKFDLSLEMTESDQGLLGVFEYNTDLFEAARIQRLIEHFQQLLTTIPQQLHTPLAQLPILTPDEHHQLQQWNNTQISYANTSLYQLFVAQAKNHVDKSAVEFNDQTISYQELQLLSQHLAHYLLSKDYPSETLIAVQMERSLEMLICLLAIQAAGLAYLPLDPNYPSKRLAFMLQDANASLVITQSHLVNTLTHDNVLIIDHWEQVIELDPQQNIILPHIQPQQLAYIIYTSGSTGKPKGVQIEQHNLTNFLHGMAEQLDITAQDRLLAITPLSFDIAALELFLPLITGATVIIAPQATTCDAELLSTLINHSMATVMQATPATWQMLLDQNWNNPSKIKQLCGGEALTSQLATRLLATGATLWNLYGPTETTIWSAAIQVQQAHPIIIGHPIANTQFYILDQQQQLCPIGVPGGIFIAGAGVGRGYLNRPELQANKFQIDPWNAQQMMYQTGDLGYWNQIGQLVCLGRSDQQIKHHGFRIELEEIENVLQQYTGIQQAVVTLYQETLLAYITGAAFNAEQLRDFAQQQLPDYMLPQRFIWLEKLPLTPNHKIDRKALPAPDVLPDTEYSAPTTGIEEVLAGLWATLLQQDKISRQAHFFEMGGHSLLATQLASHIRKTFHVELPLKAIFNHPKLMDLAYVIEQSQHCQLPEIGTVARDKPLVLSYAQQRLWLIDQLLPDNPLYNMPTAIRLKGILDSQALQHACTFLQQRHEILRTTFIEDQGIALQTIYENSDIQLEIIDLQNTESSQHEKIEYYAVQEAQQAFNLAQPPLWRIKLLRLSQRENIVLLTFHHIISDAWSINLFVQELIHCYCAELMQRPPQLTALPLQYADFSHWQQQHLTEATLADDLNYWQQQLGNKPPVLELPSQYARPTNLSIQGLTQQALIPNELRQQLQQLAHQHDVTLFMLLISAFYVLLYRYTGQEDICVGTPIAGREHHALENLLGCFVNTLVLRASLANNPNFSEFLQHIRQITLDAYSHQALPFEKLVEVLQPDRDLSHTPLFQVLFALHNAPLTTIQAPNLEASIIPVDSGIAKFDLSVNLEETSEGLQSHWEFNTDIIDSDTISRMAQHYQQLLQHIVAQPTQPLSQLGMLTTTDHQQLLQHWNNTNYDFPETALAQLFEQQVAKTPEQIAIVFAEQTLTYQQLNQQANQLAHYLRQIDMEPGKVVALCLERSAQMMIALLAIIKSGAAYLPLDTSYPAERINTILNDAKVDVLISNQWLLDHIQLPTANQIQCLNLDQALQHEQPTSNPIPLATANDLLYIIYTSGSTGQPKGAGVYQRGFSNLLHWFIREFNMTNQDKSLIISALGFDLTQKNLYAVLLCGGELHLLAGLFEPKNIAQHISEQQISLINCTPSSFYPILNYSDQYQLNSLRCLFLGGEPINANRLAALPHTTEVINTYGPTECTDICAFYRLPNVSAYFDSPIPIGRPNYNVALYVLDHHQQLLPIGAIGELVIGGAGVGAGYLQDDHLTNEKFIPNHLLEDDQHKLYRTGDMVRYLPDGNLMFIGRADHLVKLRGYRIELAEIESLLSQIANIREAAVMIKTDPAGNEQLVAYLVSHHATEVSQLVNTLKQQLPDYMIPSYFHDLPQLPISANGKIDRKALPEPDWQQTRQQQAYVAPRTPAEEVLVQIWQQILGKEKIGIEDNFFDLGGHSLLAAQIIAQIRATFEVDLALASLFETPTITGFAERLESRFWGDVLGDDIEAFLLGGHHADEDDLPQLSPVSRDQPLPLSYAQQRLWFLDQLEPGNPFYNIPAAFDITGELDINCLQQALNLMLERHESLRTNFSHGHGQPLQIIHPQRKIIINQQPMPPQLVEQARQPFDLEQGALLTVNLWSENPSQHTLLFCFHHIISDAWSISLFINEITQYYELLTQQQSVQIMPLPIQYADFALWQRQWLASDQYYQQDYWQQMLEDCSILNLPTDKPRPANLSYHGARLPFDLSSDLINQLNTLARSHDASLFMVLLATFEILLHRYTGQTDICVGTPSAGRSHAELEALQGFFVNTLVIRNNLSNNPDFHYLLEQVRDVTLGAYDHQDIPFEQLVEWLKPERDMSHTPLFQVMFALQNTPLPKLNTAQLQMTPHAVDLGVAKFDLTFECWEHADGITGSVEYNTDLFYPETIQRLIQHFNNLLHAIVKQPEQTIGQLPLLDAEEYQQLIHTWNHTQQDYDQHLCMHQLFEQQVVRNPNAVAILYDNQRWSYADLNRRANQLARHLYTIGLKPGTGIAVHMQRSPELIISLLAILKAGGAYVPLETGWPLQRIIWILENLNIHILLTDRQQLNPLLNIQWDLPELQHLICVDSETARPSVEQWDDAALDRVAAHTLMMDESYGLRVLPLIEPWLNESAWVLEIGCGHADLVFELAPRITHYVAMDPSQPSQQHNHHQALQRGFLHVQWLSGFAHEIHELAAASFDIAIVSAHILIGPLYTERVLDLLLKRVVPGGVIVITGLKTRQQDADYGLEPLLFHDYAVTYSRIASVNIEQHETGYDVCIITEKEPQETLNYPRHKMLWTQWHIQRMHEHNLALNLSSQQRAYIIFTSGSTGTPKGVEIRHHAVINVLQWVNQQFNITSKDRLLFITSVCFDLSVYDIFGTLAAGASIQLASQEDIRDPHQLLHLLSQQNITIWDSAPAAMRQLLPLLSEAQHIPDLRLVLLSGDWIPVSLPPTLQKTCPNANVISLGGATEATIWSNYFTIDEINPKWRSIPYGRPIQNAQYYILDHYLNPCPVGVIGDLYISGDCLANGYVNAAEQTENSFIPHAFSKNPNAKMYRTGDRARFFNDGNIEFLGRMDHQVKVRGYRIELGEVETILNQHAAIRDSVVIIHGKNEQAKLVAYCVPQASLDRIAIELVCMVRADDDSIILKAEDISPSGMRLQAIPDDWSVGKQLHIVLSLPDINNFEISGEIMWKRQSLAGIQFNADEQQQIRLELGIARLTEAQGFSLADFRRFSSTHSQGPSINWHGTCLLDIENAATIECQTEEISTNSVTLLDVAGKWQKNQPVALRLLLPHDTETPWLTGYVQWQTGQRLGIQLDLTEAMAIQHQQQITHMIKTEGYWLTRHNLTALREHVQSYLPDYMLPSTFVLLDSLPLTANGKLDRDALPSPQQSTLLEEQIIAPRNPTEEQLSLIIGNILGIEQISMQQSFFELGGHSLQATQLVADIEVTFKVKLSLREIFESPTVEGLATNITHHSTIAAESQSEQISRIQDDEMELVDHLDQLSDDDLDQLLDQLDEDEE